MVSDAPLLVDLDRAQIKGNEEVPELRGFKSGLSLSTVIVETKMLYAIALPMIITGLLIYGKSFVSMLFMGMIGKDALPGGSLAIGIANITGYSVISGLALGMYAISSQAFGANQQSLMARTLHRTIILLLCASIPICVLWLNIESVLIFFNQDPTISAIAATYLTFCLPDLFFQSFINPFKIYLRSQNTTSPLMIGATLGLIFHVPINYLFINYFSLGVPGIAVTAALTDLIMLTTLAVYLYLYGFSSNTSLSGIFGSFDEWKAIIYLAFPSCCSVCLEWWWYELMILLSGLLNNAAVAVATMGIIIQATSLIYIFPSSLSLAASTRIGNELGANRPGQARMSSHIALLCGMMTSVIAMSLMVMLGSMWSCAFTRDEAIIQLTALVMPVVGVCELGNCPQTTVCGVLRGCARPTLGVNINLGAFYGVGLSLALLMGFGMDMGLLGLMLGLLVAQTVCCFLMLWTLCRTNWIEQALRAMVLTGHGNNIDRRGERAT